MATSNNKVKTCEVCAANEAKYTCPKCEVRTCGLSCANIHKKELNCDGIRHKTKFIPLNSFTDLDLLSDYRLLEEIGRSVETLQKNPALKCSREKFLPTYLQRLKSYTHNKGIHLEFMPQNFSRRKENTTYLNWRSKEFFWRVEFIFQQAENTKWTLERVPDTKRLSVVLEEIFDGTNQSDSKNSDSFNQLSILQNKLKFYRSCGLTGLRALLKAEKVKKSDSRFYELDLALSLQENLKNKMIIEFPTIYVIFKDHSDMFEIIDSDDEETKPEIFNTWNNNVYSGNPRNERYRKNNQSCFKEKTGSSTNYFFNSDLSDSENEGKQNTNYRYNNYRNNNQELYIPDYNEL